MIPVVGKYNGIAKSTMGFSLNEMWRDYNMGGPQHARHLIWNLHSSQIQHNHEEKNAIALHEIDLIWMLKLKRFYNVQVYRNNPTILTTFIPWFLWEHALKT